MDIEMAFTDRFLKVPIKVYNIENAELTGKKEYSDSYIKINPFEIISYKPTNDDENDVENCVFITFKNGDGLFIYMGFEEFENLLNLHF